MKRILSSILALAALTAVAAMAQEERLPAPGVPCPRPVTITIHGASGPATPDPADLTPALVTATAGSQWNQTAVNKGFAHTFHFPAPPRECCLMTSGKLTIRVKALQGGPKASSTSANDGFTLISHGLSISGQAPWNTTGVATGTVATLTFVVPPNVLSQGMVTIYGEDDSAVLSADLILQGCCLK